ncbi:TetR/AcrR family transcriptional regulator [Nocardioides sp. CER19]|uniref:TetR/AcrR family transcriptional regulator n=1 Tax=Nocardioides sp. CER19 TaxID=3038538 RepID=UPI00244AF4F2|nr:TetR/AcrR family transcriptional regulator [Nocardioides sp. CER19]MDH2413589.1 TetR/AcrR family transcriptional regulator [Nocardioides sp. CER19]
MSVLPEGTARGDLTRARLLEAAVQAFAAKGFHGTTTRDIAAGAGMSPAAVYVHHRSKEELLYVISREGHQRTLDLVREAAASAGSPRERLAAIAREFGRHHAEGHTWARIVNYELGALSPAHLEEIRALRIGIEQEVRATIEAGVASGDFDVADPGMTTTAVLSLGIDIARWYRDDGRWTPDDVGDHMAGLALRIVGAGA